MPQHQRQKGFGPRPLPKPPLKIRTSVFNDDEPVIEASPGGTSHTLAEAAQPFSTPDRREHRESIRVVTNEHEQRLDRTSMPRKQTTKLFGGDVQEVSAEELENASSALSTPTESPSDSKRALHQI